MPPVAKFPEVGPPARVSVGVPEGRIGAIGALLNAVHAETTPALESPIMMCKKESVLEADSPVNIGDDRPEAPSVVT